MKNNTIVYGSILTMFLTMGGSLIAQNNALNFDGSNDFIAVSNISLNGYTAVTFEAWVYPLSFNGVAEDYISNLTGHDDASGLLRIGDNDPSHMQENSRPQFAVVTTDGVDKCNATTMMYANTWYHLAGTYDGSNLKIYVNGNLEDTEPHTGSISTTETSINIGGPNSSSRFFDGIVDEVRIWNTARSETEIRQNMYKELTGGESGLVAYYNLNETTGTVADNSEGTSSLDGSLTNMAGTEWLTSNAIFGPKNYLDFNGTSNYVDIPSDASFNNTTFSVEFWLKMDDTPASWDGIIDKGRYNPFQDWYFLAINGTLGAMFGVPGIGEIWFGINDNNWHHVAGTCDGTESKVYLDGKLQGTATGTYTVSTNGIRIGYTLTPWYFLNGGIDELRIWSDVRTATEIRENMCKNITGNESGLAAYYTFDYDYSPGTVLADYSGNGNDGTLINSPNWTNSTAYNTWLNTDDNSWTDTENWGLHTEPSSTDNIGIFHYIGGTSPISSTTSVQNFIVDDTFTLNADASVSDNLILESDLDLNGQTITLGSSATLIEGNGRLYGSSGTITTARVLSNITAENVGGLGAEITTTADMGGTIITRGHAAQSGSIQRYFDITPTNNSGLNATLVFHYFDAELNGQNESTLELFRSVDAGSNWTKIGGTVNTVANTVTLSPIDAFSLWTSAQNDNALPVELASFTVENKMHGVLCKWTTESEIENLGFILERKLEGANWTEIVSYKTDNGLMGQGTISYPTEYEYLVHL
ncbi:MAG: hypothetical protein GWP19_09765 [Planctomycetia bacterium]|nr:hypothetical protein [Planctomycetia bacterium]